MKSKNPMIADGHLKTHQFVAEFKLYRARASLPGQSA
jgi:hypothetical protein